MVKAYTLYQKDAVYTTLLIEQSLEVIDGVQVNPNMISQLENAGLSFVGKDETGQRMEVSIVAGDVLLYSS